MDEDLDYDLSDIDSANNISIDENIALPDETPEPEVDSRPLCHIFARGACKTVMRASSSTRTAKRRAPLQRTEPQMCVSTKDAK